MKQFPIISVSFVFIFLLLSLNVFSEGEDQRIDKGSTHISIGESAGIVGSRSYSNSIYQTLEIVTTMNLAAIYFYKYQHGLSAQLNYYRWLEKSQSASGNDYLNRDKMLYLGYTYAYPYSENIAFFAQAMLGLGAARNSFTQRYSGRSNTNNGTALQTGILFSIGAFIQLFNNPLWQIKPTVGYEFTKTNWDNRNAYRGNLNIQATLLAALSYSSLYCKTGSNNYASRTLNRYIAGRIFMETVLSFPGLNFGSSYDKANGQTINKSKNSSGGFNVGLGYYLMDMLAITTALTLNNSKTVNDISTYRNNEFLMNLGIRHHVPVEMLRNFYVFALLQFGRESYWDSYVNTGNGSVETAGLLKSQTLYGENQSSLLANETKSSFNNTGFGLGVGYDYPIADILSLYAKFQYGILYSKNTSTDAKSQSRDTEFKLGIRIELN